MHRTRAERRHHRTRIIEKTRRILRSWSNSGFKSQADYEKFIEHFSRKLANNRAACSGRCCGNQRSWEGPPISESRRLAKYEHEDE